MHNKNKSYMGSTRICPICNKEFAKQSDKWILSFRQITHRFAHRLNGEQR